MRSEVVEAFRGARRILLTSHSHVDGDSAGAALALIEAGRRLGKIVAYVNSEPVPALYDFLPGIETLSAPVPEDAPWDLGIVLDTSFAERVGSVWPRFADLPRVVIDHHEGGCDAAETAWIDPRAAAVTILVGELLDELGVALDASLALPLYVGLFTDTWAFQQSNTDERAMMWGARFVAAGVKPYEVSMAWFERKRLAAIRLCGRAAERARIEDGICHAWLAREDFAETGAGEADTEGIVTHLRAADGIRVAVLFRELEGGRVKANFRSKDATDVSAVARAFGGGGHKPAAGCTVEGTLEEVRRRVLERLRKDMTR